MYSYTCDLLYKDLITRKKYHADIFQRCVDVCWLYFIIPKLVPGWKGVTIASLVLLGFPGFQKLGVMTHPDNLLVGLSATAVVFCPWIHSGGL